MGPRRSPQRTAFRARSVSIYPTKDGVRSSSSRRGSRKHGIRAVYASPLSRTLETARILGAPLGFTPVLRDGLREISHGHWEGLTREEVETRYPGEYAT